MSRPQLIHAHGSNAIAHGSRSDSAARPSAPAISQSTWRELSRKEASSSTKAVSRTTTTIAATIRNDHTSTGVRPAAIVAPCRTRRSVRVRIGRASTGAPFSSWTTSSRGGRRSRSRNAANVSVSSFGQFTPRWPSSVRLAGDPLRGRRAERRRADLVGYASSPTGSRSSSLARTAGGVVARVGWR